MRSATEPEAHRVGDLSPRDVPPDRRHGWMATESSTSTDCPLWRDLAGHRSAATPIGSYVR
jgi:hypothetical protein